MKSLLGAILLTLIFSASTFAEANDEVKPSCESALGRLTKAFKFGLEIIDFMEKMPFAVTVKVLDTKDSFQMAQRAVNELLAQGLKAETIGAIQHSSSGTSIAVTINDLDSYRRFINYALEEQDQSRLPYVEGFDFVPLVKAESP